MKVEKEYSGTWWSPKYPDHKLPGILEIAENGTWIRLKVFSSKTFKGESIPESEKKGRLSSKMIVGEVDFGYKITLFHNTKSEFGQPFRNQAIARDFYQISFAPSHAIIGTLFESDDKVHFHSMSFKFNLFHYWMENGWGRYYDRPDTDKDLIEIKPKDDVVVELNENDKIHFERWSSKTEQGLNLEVKINHFATFKLKTPADLSYYYSLCFKLQSFFTIALGCMVVKQEEQAVPIGKIDWNYKSVPIVHRRPIPDPSDFVNTNVGFIDPRDYFYPEDKVKLIQKWFSIFDSIHSSLDLFLQAVDEFWSEGSRPITNVDFTNSFLNVTQAVETYFKRNKGTRYEEVRETVVQRREKILNSVKKHISQDDLEFLKKNTRIPKPEGIGFQKIIYNLLFEYRVVLSAYVREDEIAALSETIKQCRDDLTHINYDDPDQFEDKYDVGRLFTVCQIIYLVLLGNRLEMDNEMLKRRVEKIWRFQPYLLKNMDFQE